MHRQNRGRLTGLVKAQSTTTLRSQVNYEKLFAFDNIISSVKDQLAQLNRTTFSPYRGPGEQNKDVGAACAAAVDRYGGFFGPFVDV